jgi:hypothetical protein
MACRLAPASTATLTAGFCACATSRKNAAATRNPLILDIDYLRVIVTLALADFVGSAALTAVMVTVEGEGTEDGAV